MGDIVVVRVFNSFCLPEFYDDITTRTIPLQTKVETTLRIKFNTLKPLAVLLSIVASSAYADESFTKFIESSSEDGSRMPFDKITSVLNNGITNRELEFTGLPTRVSQRHNRRHSSIQPHHHPFYFPYSFCRKE